VKRTIRVFCSSFVNSQDLAWRQLQQKYELIFESFGMILPTPIHTKSELEYSLILFFADDFNVDESRKIDDFKKLVDKLCESSSRYTASANKIILFCFLSDPIYNSIKESRSTSDNLAFHDYAKKTLQELAKTNQQIYFLDFDNIIRNVSRSEIFSERNWYFGRHRLTSLGLKLVIEELLVFLHGIESPRKKVLLLDCDNTLWGGIVGEVGVQGISLGTDGIGNAFQDFQKVIKKLSIEGILICLLSKNDENAIWEVFDRHSEMILKREDITAHRINWNSKVDNVKELALELDLGVESFAFWDDNPLERDFMKEFRPEVQTIEPPIEVFRWPRYLSELQSFSSAVLTNEDVARKLNYKSRNLFKQQSTKFETHADFLSSLNLVVEYFNINDANIARAEQLSMKTNQLNLTLKRRNKSDMLDIIMNEKNSIFLVSLRDIYGDHGLIGLVILIEVSSELAYLDTFLISCRVFGRDLEKIVFKEALIRCKEMGFQRLLVEHKLGDRNLHCSDLIRALGCSPVGNEDDISELKVVHTRDNLSESNLYIKYLD
jgi:FkbH-like protein